MDTRPLSRHALIIPGETGRIHLSDPSCTRTRGHQCAGSLDPLVKNGGAIRSRPCGLEIARRLHDMVSGDHMFRRYSPPTSYKAWLICPSEWVLTASIRAANTFLRSRAVFCR